MGSYLATWSVFVIDDRINDPVSAAVAARAMADDHSASMWGIEDLSSEDGPTVSVDLETRQIIPIEELDDEDVA